MKLFFYILLFIMSLFSISFSRTFKIGENEKFTNLQSAASEAGGGDTLLIKSGIYNGGMYIEDLKGTTDKYIYIIAEPFGEVIIQGGSNAIQFSDPAFLVIEGITFQEQSGNGLNIDDGATYATPAGNLILRNCTFRDMNGSGNNDLLKLSGLDNFLIDSCLFENGAAGGSGIDMVGCNNGTIQHCRFSNMGSNAIQAKGGTSNIDIYANFFENCGQRTLNLGGSTGLDFFRPIDAKFEAADLNVHSNIIIGSVAAIAYVGSINVKVINNTIVNPEKWVIRILQETVDEERFEQCGNNTFSNNLIYLGNLNTETNIGPDTSPESFKFSDNFWYNYENINWAGPDIPVIDDNQIINLSPEFENISEKNFKLKEGSPAIACINYLGKPNYDYYGNAFLNPRSAGAIEFKSPTFLSDNNSFSRIVIFPNPASDYIEVNLERCQTLSKCLTSEIKIYNTFGECVMEFPDVQHLEDVGHLKRIDISQLPAGIYYIQIKNYSERFVVVR